MSSTKADLLTYLIPIASAFFGAAAAFVLALLKDKTNEFDKQLASTNVALYGLRTTIEKLINIKTQLLAQPSVDLDELKDFLTRSDGGSQSHLSEAAARFHQILIRIRDGDDALSRAFGKWPDCDFELLPKPHDLVFTIAEKPELLRLLLLANSETVQIRARIAERNAVWQKLEPYLIAETKTVGPSLESLPHRFSLLELRTVISVHVDTSLVVIREALDQLNQYSRATYTKRNRTARSLFGKRTRITINIKDELKQFIPDRSAYSNVVGPIANPQNANGDGTEQNNPQSFRELLVALAA